MEHSTGGLLSSIPRIAISILIVILLPGIIQAAPAEGSGDQSAVVTDYPAIDAYFFYGDGCIHCENIKPYIADLALRHPRLKIQYLETYHNATNRRIFERVTTALGLKNVGVPALIIGNNIFIGEYQIRSGAEPRIIELEQKRYPSNPAQTGIPAGGNEICTGDAGGLTLLLVISCALIDSVNPCAFAVLAFLLLSIITVETRRRVLMVGGIYITAVFIFYLLSGMGLFAVVQGSGLSQILFVGAAIISIIFGLVNITDVIRKNEGFILAIPESKKDRIQQYMSDASLPAAFVLGILVGIFELPCTGGIYLAILSMMSRTLTFQAGLPYLVLYNLIFILPLVIILLVVSFGLSPERVNSWRFENRRLLRFIIGIAMIAIGAVMLFSLL
ncbi:MAG: Cytochrome C biogenesis protein transmembrane region [Methanoregula sp. PtaU1.Bin051]|nr:MAG: Cytochrome C biogenesis protein transmembrane region [Methanoregula sp. PtaU1.Bin051]